jgi:hypothetical protein
MSVLGDEILDDHLIVLIKDLLLSFFSELALAFNLLIINISPSRSTLGFKLDIFKLIILNQGILLPRVKKSVGYTV